jgi:hypothetical protein
MTDAILFSANPSMVDVDDAMRHLEDHKELYWTVGFLIDKESFSFPLFGFIHVRGGQVGIQGVGESRYCGWSPQRRCT